MPVFTNLDGTSRGEFSIGKNNTVKIRTNGGIIEWQNTDGVWHKFTAPCYIKSADPTASDDASQGYLVGDFWFNTVNSKIWTCKLNTIGVAQWQAAAGGSSSSSIWPSWIGV